METWTYILVIFSFFIMVTIPQAVFSEEKKDTKYFNIYSGGEVTTIKKLDDLSCYGCLVVYSSDPSNITNTKININNSSVVSLPFGS